MAGYFDYVLGLIPLILFGTTGGLLAVGLSLSLAASVGGALSAVLVGHAMFVRAPRDTPTPANVGTADHTPGGD